MFRFKRLYFIVAVFFAVIFIFISVRHLIHSLFFQSPPVHLIKCYDNSSFTNKLNVLESRSVRLSNSIFFVETRCHDDLLNISPRQACAVESAALLNPEYDVFLLLPSPVKNVNNFEPHLRKLFNYPNFRMRHINMDVFFEGTPLETWYKKHPLKWSYWPTSHCSDVLRYTLLWKYGGTYSDLDVVFLKPLAGFTNFSGAEDPEDVAAGFISVSFMHPIADMFMQDLRQNFRGDLWGHNGPGVVTRVLKKYCNTRMVQKMTESACHGFKVLPPSAFYPIPWRNWRWYFLESELHNVTRLIKNSFAVHVWNFHSSNTSLMVGSKQPYTVLAQKFCPQVYSTIKGAF